MRPAPLIVEIVGPAGAGKTSFLSALQSQEPAIRPIYRFREKQNIHYYIISAILLLPTFVCRGKLARRNSWQEINWMIRLHAGWFMLKQLELKSSAAIFIDQGPIYTLTMLDNYGNPSSEGQCYARWRAKTIKRWATNLDAIIWLDAPDDVLIERIRARKKWHLVKGKSQQEAKDFLKGFRAMYKQSIGEFKASRAPKVFCYDTNEQPLARIVADVLAALNLGEESDEATRTADRAAPADATTTR